jgi:glycosyltransferase involved in cell wall biosynthesis
MKKKEMMDRAKISICIPSYQYGKFLPAAIESALQQRVNPCEIIVSDNWSTDNTSEIIKQYGSLIKGIKPEFHLCMSDHFYFIINKAKGDYVVVLCADDALHPHFLERVIPYLNRYAMVATGGFACDSDMKPIRYSGLTYLTHRKMAPGEGFDHFLPGCGYVMSGSVFDRRWMLQIPRLPISAGYALSWYLAIFTGAYRSIAMLASPLHYYRYHGENSSHSNPEKMLSDQRSMLHFLASLECLGKDRQSAASEMAEAYDNSNYSFFNRNKFIFRQKLSRKLINIISWILCRIYPHPNYLR